MEKKHKEALDRSARGVRYSLCANIITMATAGILIGSLVDAHLGDGHNMAVKILSSLLAGAILGVLLHSRDFHVAKLSNSGFAESGPTEKELKDYLKAKDEQFEEEHERISDAISMYRYQRKMLLESQ